MFFLFLFFIIHAGLEQNVSCAHVSTESGRGEIFRWFLLSAYMQAKEMLAEG